MTTNRTRNKAITLRMTENEFAMFKRKFKLSRLKSQTDFLLALLDKKQIVLSESFDSVLVELKRQGNNLNQIARQLNQGSPIGLEARDVLHKCYEVYNKLMEVK